MKDYLDKFLFVHNIYGITIYQDLVKTITLRGITDSPLDVLNFIGNGNITTLPLDDRVELWKNSSRTRTSKRKVKLQNKYGVVNTLIDKHANFKINILVELN